MVLAHSTKPFSEWFKSKQCRAAFSEMLLGTGNRHLVLQLCLIAPSDESSFLALTWGGNITRLLKAALHFLDRTHRLFYCEPEHSGMIRSINAQSPDMG